jgi:DNA-binding transcriptional MocR family regulator
MPSHANLYEQLADELDTLIANRVFTPGDRLPSIRHLAKQKRLSVTTVMQALRLLEDRGLIDAKPQAGFYVRHRGRLLTAIDDCVKEATEVGISSLLMRVLQANDAADVVQFGSARIPEEMLPIKRIQQTIGTVTRRHPALLASVSCTAMNEPHFVRQITRRAIDWGRLDPHEIVVTSSCTEAISLCLRAVAKTGDTIAIESPTYFVLLQLIESLGMKALEIPTDPHTGLSVDALEHAIEQRRVQACLFIPNANNPLGSIMSENDKKRLAALVSRHDIPLIEDDIYGDLCFTSQRPPPVKAYDSSGNVLLCSSFSKTIAPAAQAGYVAAGKYAQQVALLKVVSSGATGHFFQAVLADFIGGSSYDSQLRKMRRLLTQRIHQMADAVSKFFPAECLLSEPQGGFVLWVALPAQVDALALHACALEQRIAFMPGPLFSASGRFGNYMRLNCSNAWNADIEQAVRKLGVLVHRFANHSASRVGPN